MALEVWLPLQADGTGIKNNGQDSLTVVNHGCGIAVCHGKKGSCATFYGGDYLQFSKGLDNHDIYKGDFTWAFWICPRDKHRGAIISDWQSSTQYYKVALEITATLQVRVYWNNSPDIKTTVTLPIYEWTHVVVTKGASQDNRLNIYFNGQMVLSSAALDISKIYDANAEYTDSCLRIGNDYRYETNPTLNALYGNLTDVRIYSNCLTPSEVLQLYNETRYYQLEKETPSPESIRQCDSLVFAPGDGGSTSIILPPGSYQLQCWGASGGNNGTSNKGGGGGASYGTLELLENTTLYLYAGGKGTTTNTVNTQQGGGFNGGGAATSTSTSLAYSPGGGGGGSDIRIGQDSLYARIMVAGGGGGANYYSGSGGDGGGTIGASGTTNGSNYYAGEGGTTTGPGTSYYGTSVASSTNSTGAGFGYGASAEVNSNYSSGGGGGWYGGGSSRRSAAGGGSGYVYTSSTAYAYPNGNLLNNNYYLGSAAATYGTITEEGYTTSFSDDNGETCSGHRGDGVVQIFVRKVYTVVNIPALTDKSYNGLEQTPGESNYNADAMTKEGQISATLPGTYFITYKLKKGYMWSDKTFEEKTIAWNITSQFKKMQGKIYDAASDSFINFAPQISSDGTSFSKQDVWIYSA